MQSQTLYVSTRGPTSGSGMNLKKTIAAIAAVSMSVASFAVATNGGMMDAEEKMIGKPQSAGSAVKNLLSAGDRDGGWGKRMTAGQPELAGFRKTTEADAAPFACLRNIGSAMRKVTRHSDTGGPVALAMAVSA